MTIHEAKLQLLNCLTPLYDDRESVLIADMVLEHITGWSKIDRVVNKSVPLSLPQTELLDTIIVRLSNKEPVQYILEESWFAGLKFFVNKYVLIPRPETEELVDWICKEIEKRKGEKESISILDIGTGSGCIPVFLKTKIPMAAITAIDVCSDALSVAINNAVTNETEIDFKLVDILNKRDWEKLPVFDIIVSNPPYIPNKDKVDMHSNVLEHEPHIALFVPDEEPLLFYKAIAEFAKFHLKEKGSIYLEIHEGMGEKLTALFKTNGFAFTEIKKDMQGKDRMVKVK